MFVQRSKTARRADQLSRFAVPGQDPSEPIIDSQDYPVYYPGTNDLAGTVRTYISNDGLTTLNVTNPGHVFYDGQVVRMAIQASDGSWSVTTQGIGNDKEPGMNIINQVSGKPIFDALDQKMKAYITAHHEN